MQEEITVTLTSLETANTESISVSSNGTTLSELCDFAVALLNIETSPTDRLLLSKDGRALYTRTGTMTTNGNGNNALSTVGIENGDVIAVVKQQAAPSNSRTGVSSSSGVQSSNTANSSGGLDFSSLLAATPSTTSSSTVNTNLSVATSSGNSGGLTFNLPLLNAQTSLTSNRRSTSSTINAAPVEWEGMNLDDAIARNQSPENFIAVLLNTTKHPNLLKELNYHNPTIANKLKNAPNHSAAVQIWRQMKQSSVLNATLTKTMTAQTETEMRRRLMANPMDADANKYFGEQIQKENVQRQYEQMMEQFPESMGRVLMLYIDLNVNGHSMPAFVDSGAQSTIMSSRCAEKCGILHLLDERFAGTAVGVGTGKILGRIHLISIQVENHFFPCTITVMDSEEGLGDKNMDFLFGLDVSEFTRIAVPWEHFNAIFCSFF